MKAVDGLKRCPGCHETKAVAEFYKDKLAYDGLNQHCKACVAVRNKAYYDAHQEQERARYVEHGDERRAKGAIYRAVHREVMQAYRDATAEHKRIQSRAYYALHPETALKSGRKRRAHRAAVGGTITTSEWNELAWAFGNRCLCCGTKDKPLTMDHVIPLSKGGPHVIANVQPLCQTCNNRKGVREVDYRCP
jgi:5-methylcytosine-specific restriction endonuclease McrA